MIGPHLAFDDNDQIWDNDICQFFFIKSNYLLQNSTWQHMVSKFPKKPVDFDPEGKLYVIHLGYANHIQSDKQEVIDKSFSDLKYNIRSAMMLFPKETQVMINMHMVSKKPFNEELLLQFAEALPDNMKLVLEHVPGDKFPNFLKVFGALTKKSKKIGLTFDTAHIYGSGFSIEDLLNKVDIQPSLIHLNGNKTKFGSGSDEHVPMMSELDQIWDKNLLKNFLQKYKDVPKIIEARDQRNYQQDLKLIKKIMGK